MNHHHAIAGLLLAASLAATRVVAAADAPPLARWGLDEQDGSQTVEQVSGRRDHVNYVFNRARFKPDSPPLWRPAASCIQQGCLLFDGYSTDVTAPPLTSAQLQGGFTLSAWVAPHAFEWGDGGHYSAFVSQFDAGTREGFSFGVYRFGTWGIKVGLGASVLDVRVTDRKLASFGHQPSICAKSRTVLMRWRTLRAVSGIFSQIGARAARTIALVIESTGLSPKCLKTWPSNDDSQESL